MTSDIAEVRILLAPFGEAGRSLTAEIEGQCDRSPFEDDPLGHVLEREWPWRLMLDGDPLDACASQLGLGWFALQAGVEAGLFSNVAKILIDISPDGPRKFDLVTARSRLVAHIQEREHRRWELIEVGNHYVDRGEFDAGHAAYQRALNAFPRDDLATYEIARTEFLRDENGQSAYQEALVSVLKRHPFFEQAMQIDRSYLEAYNVRLRPWVRDGTETPEALADFAAGALDAGLARWAAVSYVALAYIDVSLASRLPDALDAAGVPESVSKTSSLRRTAEDYAAALLPLRNAFSQLMLCADGRLGVIPPATITQLERAREIVGMAPVFGDALAERGQLAAAAVLLALERLLSGDPSSARILARKALGFCQSALEHANSYEVEALALQTTDAWRDAEPVLARSAELHVLAGSSVADQVRVLTRLASICMQADHPQHARTAVERALGLQSACKDPVLRDVVIDMYLKASADSELGDVEEGMGTWQAARALRETLKPTDMVPPGTYIANRSRLSWLQDNLRYQEQESYVNVTRATLDAPALLNALQEWWNLAVDLSRSSDEIASIWRKIDVVSDYMREQEDELRS